MSWCLINPNLLYSLALGITREIKHKVRKRKTSVEAMQSRFVSDSEVRTLCQYRKKPRAELTARHRYLSPECPVQLQHNPRLFLRAVFRGLNGNDPRGLINLQELKYCVAQTSIKKRVKPWVAPARAADVLLRGVLVSRLMVQQHLQSWETQHMRVLNYLNR